MERDKIGLNGFGRIGSTFTRIAIDRGLDLSLINTRRSPASRIAQVLQNDFIYGMFPHEVRAEKDHIIVNGQKIKVSISENIDGIPWDVEGIDIVVDASGAYKTKGDLEKHLAKGVKKVILTTVSKDDDIPHIVLGVNDEDFDFKNSTVISNSSCTTNSAAILYKILHDRYGIEKSSFTTVHAYTQSQEASLDDLTKIKPTDLKMIPSTTGASKGIVRTIPELRGKIEGLSLRVPTPTVSFTDITALIKNNATAEEINDLFREMSEGKLKNILGYAGSFSTSSDFIGSTFSTIFDANYTKVLGGNLVKIYGWYDNEWGYSSRLVDLVERLSNLF